MISLVTPAANVKHKTNSLALQTSQAPSSLRNLFECFFENPAALERAAWRKRNTTGGAARRGRHQ